MADIFLGFLLTHNALQPVSDFCKLLAASSCLYLAGMVFNDVFDRTTDAIERPNRPLPSGHVSLKAACGIGAMLVVAGNLAAYSVGSKSLVIALALSLCIFAYNGGAKKTFLGPVAMGGCRFLNVMLGASATFFVWATPQWFVALALGVYVAGVTWFAKNEAEISRRRHLMAATGLMSVGLLLLLFFVIAGRLPPFAFPLRSLTGAGSGNGDPLLAMLLLFVVFISIFRRALSAIFQPAPARVQAAVKTMLLSLVLLDAAIIFFKTGSGPYALATASLVIPAMYLGRWIFMT
jgi:4-hydroxybenzoate polyprenyltransferase